MPFTIKSRKAIETPLESAYKKQIAQHTRDNDPSAPKFPPKPLLRSFSLVDDTVTLSFDQPEGTVAQDEVESSESVEQLLTERKSSEPVTPDEKNELGIFSVRV